MIGKVLIIIKNDHLGTDNLKETNELKYHGLYFASSFSFNFHTYNNANSSLVHCTIRYYFIGMILINYFLHSACMFALQFASCIAS